MFAAALLTLGSEARAQANLHSADVLRPGDNMIYGEVGWPDAAFGFKHGVNDIFDIGVRAALIYGFEYTTLPGLGLGVNVPLRFTPLKRPRVSLQIHFDPGLEFANFGSSGLVCVRVNPNGTCAAFSNAAYYYSDYFGNGALHFGLKLEFGLDVGIHINRDATITVGFDAPFYVNLTNNPQYGALAALPILFGPAFEYHINDQMSVGGQVRLGPDIIVNSEYQGANFCGVVVGGVAVTCGPPTPLGLIANAFFAYRL